MLLLISIKMLMTKRIEEYIESAIDRMKVGHTNFRPYVMMSALMAHIDASIAGQSVEKKILETIKECLVIAHKLLRSCLPGSPLEDEPLDTEIQSYGVKIAGSVQEMIRHDMLDAEATTSTQWWLLSEDLDTFA